MSAQFPIQCTQAFVDSASPKRTPESTRQTHADDELNRKQFVKRTMEGFEQNFQFEFGIERRGARASQVGVCVNEVG